MAASCASQRQALLAFWSPFMHILCMATSGPPALLLAPNPGRSSFTINKFLDTV